MRKLYYITAALIMVAAFSCDAPRNNPLDPMNSNGLGIIRGTVQTMTLPYMPINEVSVFFDKGDALVKTDGNGAFNMEKVPMTDGNLIFTKEGYLSDTIAVNWAGSKLFQVGVNLRSIPVIDDLTFYTVVINQYNTDPSYELVIKAHIIDRDNDVDSVYLFNQTYSLKQNLDFDPTEKTYNATITSQGLLAANITDIEQLIGEDFQVIAIDVFGRKYITGIGKVTRVIKSEVENLSPAGGDTTGIYPTFKWNRFKAGYPFTYNMDIYTNDLANSQLIFSKQGIAADQTEFTSTVALDKREYYWVMWIVDSFQNRSRSKPKTFEVR